MAPEPLPSPAIWQERVSQWLHSQAGQGAPMPATGREIDRHRDGDAETVILRPSWLRVFPPI